MEKTTEFFLSLGGNLGDRVANLQAARHRLEEGGWVHLEECSPLYETEPWGVEGQPWYLNQVCRGRTALPPRALLFWLQSVERLGGRDRDRETRWGARTLDLDLLSYGSLLYEDNLVRVPHPRLHERRFVLRPMADLAPEWRHPELGLTVREMLERVEDSGVVRPFPVPV